jgi:carbonic anhydrase
MNQLRPTMTMKGDMFAIRVVAGQCRHRTGRSFAILDCAQSVHNATMIVIFPRE